MVMQQGGEGFSHAVSSRPRDLFHATHSNRALSHSSAPGEDFLRVVTGFQDNLDLSVSFASCRCRPDATPAWTTTTTSRTVSKLGRCRTDPGLGILRSRLLWRRTTSLLNLWRISPKLVSLIVMSSNDYPTRQFSTRIQMLCI